MTQHWEYQSLIVRSEHLKEKLYLSVYEVNGNGAGFRDDKGNLCFHELHEYLELMGKEGWESVGLSPMSITMSGAISNTLLLLRRPA